MPPTDLPGIVNGHRVNGHLYRGGDVSLAGVGTLHAWGIVRVISLENAKQDSPAAIIMEHAQVEDAGMKWTNVPMDSQGILSYDDGKKVPGILAMIEETVGPVLVHCHRGADRSGVVVACYRITKGWSADQALAEMRHYGASFIHFGMRSFVKKFAREHVPTLPA